METKNQPTYTLVENGVTYASSPAENITFTVVSIVLINVVAIVSMGFVLVTV